MSFITVLKETVRKARPSIRETSLNLYVNNVNKLSKLYDGKAVGSLEFLKNKAKITEIIGLKKPNTQKTYLASIVVVLMAFDADPELIGHYRDLMEAIAKEEGDK